MTKEYPKCLTQGRGATSEFGTKRISQEHAAVSALRGKADIVALDTRSQALTSQNDLEQKETL